ncbi:MAG: CAP domain-containing protein [Myxococcales bacterium]
MPKSNWAIPCAPRTWGRWLFLALAWLAGAPPQARALTLPCQHEDVLAEVAANLLLRGRAIDPSQLLPEARSLGFDGVAVHAHEGQDEAALIAWITSLSERADGPLVCGEASSETRRLVLVSARGGELARSGDVIRGHLAPGFRAPHLVVESADGRVQRIDIGISRLEQGVRLPAELEARRVQLVADGPRGPRPVAELNLGAEPALPAQAAPASVAEQVKGPRTRPLDALFARLDGFRANSGVGTLRPNSALSRSAQRHAQRVCELGQVGHRLQGADPETRLREEHIEARGVGEAIARAESADAALAAVFESPSHRLAVTDRRFTDAGLGQALDAKGHTCVVVLLASWPRRIP